MKQGQNSPNRSHPSAIRLGIETPGHELRNLIGDKRFGLLMNQASVDAQFGYASQRLDANFPRQLKAIFAPQHGLWSEQQDNMIETPHAHDPHLDIPVYSLYSETRKPTPHMLAGLDLMVVDLQDVGTRVYTFVWTLWHALEACGEAGIDVVVFDRPNPIGGLLTEGRRLDPDYTSFVGLAPIPMRHAMTIGELALWLVRAFALPTQVSVVPMEGWRRWMTWQDLGRAWVPTSPNLPRFEGVAVYPGQVLLEGTNLSEGRGTTTPFEVFGAPFLDPFELAEALAGFALPGVVFRPIRFEPTFQKWMGKSCGGLFVHVVDYQTFRPYRTTLAILAATRRLYPEAFQWREPPYEYETVKLPIDILAGGRHLREAVDSLTLKTSRDLDELCNEQDPSWRAERESVELYP